MFYWNMTACLGGRIASLITFARSHRKTNNCNSLSLFACDLLDILIWICLLMNNNNFADLTHFRIVFYLLIIALRQLSMSCQFLWATCFVNNVKIFAFWLHHVNSVQRQLDALLINIHFLHIFPLLVNVNCFGAHILIVIRAAAAGILSYCIQIAELFSRNQ